jgi:plastocyanin domain-containing protein
MKKNLPTALAALAAVALVGFALVSRGGPAIGPESGAEPIAAIPEGAQVVTVNAKGGYSPEAQTAKAGVPTVLKVVTNGTYDCSTALRVPSLGVSKRLPPTGETLISLGTPAAGRLQGTCSMGMYSFEIEFRA